MSNAKRQWSTPQLIVLARGTPEESVLTNCKFIDQGNPPVGPGGNQQEGCAIITTSNCAACQARPPRGT